MSEVMISIVIFAIGMLAASALQLTTLQVNRNAEEIKELTNIASAEIELKRKKHRDNVWDPTEGQTCNSFTQNPTPNYSCSVAVQPCLFDSNKFECKTSQVPDPAAHLIVVTASKGQKDQKGYREMSLSTMVRTQNLVGANP